MIRLKNKCCQDVKKLSHSFYFLTLANVKKMSKCNTVWFYFGFKVHKAISWKLSEKKSVRVKMSYINIPSTINSLIVTYYQNKTFYNIVFFSIVKDFMHTQYLSNDLM